MKRRLLVFNKMVILIWRFEKHFRAIKKFLPYFHAERCSLKQRAHLDTWNIIKSRSFVGKILDGRGMKNRFTPYKSKFYCIYISRFIKCKSRFYFMCIRRFTTCKSRFYCSYMYLYENYGTSSFFRTHESR